MEGSSIITRVCFFVGVSFFFILNIEEVLGLNVKLPLHLVFCSIVLY